MAIDGPAIRTYSPDQFTVLPGSAARGGILGLYYIPVSVLLGLVLREVFGDTALEAAFEGALTGVGWWGIVALGFTVPIGLSLVLAWLGYRCREYEVGPDGITERRGILFRSERLLTYEELEGVTVTESFVQSLYGAGTIRLTDVNRADDEQLAMKLSYIENPGEVSTSILRHLADVTGETDRRLETGDVPELGVESASVSRLSGSDLAAGTGFRYLMPTAILHPRPGKAATYGSFLGLTYALVGAGVLYYLRDTVIGLTGLPSMDSFLASVAVGALAVTAFVTGYFYWSYDRTQYELYDDHVRVIRGDETTSLSVEDVADVELEARWMGPFHGLGAAVVPWSDGGTIVLLDDQGDELVEFEYIGNAQAVSSALSDWLVGADGDTGTDEGSAPAESPE